MQTQFVLCVWTVSKQWAMIPDDTRAPGLSRREIPNLQASATNWCDIILSDSTPSISLTLILFLSISPCPFSVLHKRWPKGQNKDRAGQIDIVCVCVKYVSVCVDTGDILCTAKRFSHTCHAREWLTQPAICVSMFFGEEGGWLLEKRGKRERENWEMHLGSSTYIAKVKRPSYIKVPLKSGTPLRARSSLISTSLSYTSFYPVTHDPH